jgi:hypothetical protein
VKLPLKVQRQYKSKKFKQTLFTDARFYEKYAEKWKIIAQRLTGLEFPVPSWELIKCMRDIFIQIQAAFEYTRHAPDCPGASPHCHSRANCRYKVPRMIITAVIFLVCLLLAVYIANNVGPYSLFLNWPFRVHFRSVVIFLCTFPFLVLSLRLCHAQFIGGR